MIIVGADPGLDGALVMYNAQTQRIVFSTVMPTMNVSKKAKETQREISWPTLAQSAHAYIQQQQVSIHLAVIEHVTSSPQMGVASAFKFGGTYHGLLSMFATFEWPVERVTPAVWKKFYKLGKDKEGSLYKASQLMPSDVSHWTVARNYMNATQAGGVAEAALIARWGAETISSIKQHETKRRERVRL